MNTRSLPEWIGRTADTAAPPRVRLRVFAAHEGCCACCGRKIMTGEKWELDHIVALVNGGQNKETNLQPILAEHHRNKTRADVAEKSAVYERQLSHAGIRKRKRQSFPTNKAGPFKKRMDGSVVRR